MYAGNSGDTIPISSLASSLGTVSSVRLVILLSGDDNSFTAVGLACSDVHLKGMVRKGDSPLFGPRGCRSFDKGLRLFHAGTPSFRTFISNGLLTVK